VKKLFYKKIDELTLNKVLMRRKHTNAILEIAKLMCDQWIAKC